MTMLDSLKQKGLLIELTQAGRGQVVTHAPYKERKLADLRSQDAGGAVRTVESDEPTSARASTPMARAVAREDTNQIAELRSELEELRELIERLTDRVERIETMSG